MEWSDGSIEQSHRIAEYITIVGDDGYIASRCNDDWTDYFLGIARTVQRYVRGSKTPNAMRARGARRIKWGSGETQAKCFF